MKATSVKINWHPGSSIYAVEKFLKLVGDEYGWLGGKDDAGKLRCLLPYTVVRKATVSMVRFRIETIPLVEDLSLDEERAFLNSAVEYFRSIGADLIIPASTNSIFRTFPRGAVAAPYGSYVIDMRKTEDVLFAQMSATHRKRIRHAVKNGIKIKCGTEYSRKAHIIIKNTLKRSCL